MLLKKILAAGAIFVSSTLVHAMPVYLGGTWNILRQDAAKYLDLTGDIVTAVTMNPYAHNTKMGGVNFSFYGSDPDFSYQGRDHHGLAWDVDWYTNSDMNRLMRYWGGRLSNGWSDMYFSDLVVGEEYKVQLLTNFLPHPCNVYLLNRGGGVLGCPPSAMFEAFLFNDAATDRRQVGASYNYYETILGQNGFSGYGSNYFYGMNDWDTGLLTFSFVADSSTAHLGLVNKSSTYYGPLFNMATVERVTHTNIGNSVPEPTSIALLLPGLALLGARFYRRRRLS